jgi:hypothetical protein
MDECLVGLRGLEGGQFVPKLVDAFARSASSGNVRLIRESGGGFRSSAKLGKQMGSRG